MAERQKKSFGHQLFCLLGISTKAMNNPRLRKNAPFRPARCHHLPTKRQQLIKSLNTMNNHRLPHFLRNSYLGTKSLYLNRQSHATHLIQSTLAYRPHIRPLCFNTDASHRFTPRCIHLPRMQTYRKMYTLRILRLQLRSANIP